MDRYLWVAFGSATGGIARFWLTQMGLAWWGASFPWGTLVINLLGSALIGVFAGMDGALSAQWKLLLMTGVCGGFTTFSSFSLQSLELIERGDVASAMGYVVASVGLCLLGCWIGYAGVTNHL
jgi:CrcB protein